MSKATAIEMEMLEGIWKDFPNMPRICPNCLAKREGKDTDVAHASWCGFWMDVKKKRGLVVEEVRRKAFICVHCEGVYADEPVSQCDCMQGTGHDFIEGVIIYKKKP